MKKQKERKKEGEKRRGKSEFDFSVFKKAKILKKRGTERKYLDIVCAFDIETTTLKEEKQAFMYIWQFAIEEQIITGRTWNEFLNFTDSIKNNMPEDTILCVYIHNASYEFQYLKSVIPVNDVMATDSRRIVKFSSSCFEFRCSYYLSNMSLDRFVISAGGKYRKQENYDYEKIRYPDTALSEEEMKYCVYDVKALVSAIRNKMKKDGDTLATIPLTSTGYVRRTFKSIMIPYRKMIDFELPDLDLMYALRSAFRGGNTHGNRFNAGHILNDVHSYDISSSYPSVMLSEEYPARFEMIEADKAESEMQSHKAVLMQIDFYDIELANDSWGCPYLAKAKFKHISNGEYDNGRILSADSLLGAWFTEVDFQIITEEYKFNYVINKAYSAYKKKLPPDVRSEILRLYSAKTSLKGVDEYMYNREKARLNSIYGLFVQNPMKPDYQYVNGSVELDESVTDEDLIERYHERGFLPYQVGVYVTAYARQKLETGLKMIRNDDFVYADTDSIKVTGNYDRQFNRLNRLFLDKRYSAKDRNGKTYYCGIFEKDAHYKRFVTLGAKKYAYEDDEGKLHVTVSGVSKKYGAEELGKLENFQPGFIFRKSAGSEAVYNDEIQMKYMKHDGHDICITSNIALIPSTYTLGITAEYSKLINFLFDTDIRYSLYYKK